MFIYLLLGVCSIFWSQYNPDMKILGMWELQLYSIFHLFSTNRAESFNAWLKRNFPKRRAYTEDQIISGGHNIISGKLNRILRAQYSVGATPKRVASSIQHPCTKWFHSKRKNWGIIIVRPTWRSRKFDGIHIFFNLQRK